MINIEHGMAGAEIIVVSEEVEENVVNDAKVEEVPFFPQYLRAYEVVSEEAVPSWALIRSVYLVSEEQARALLSVILNADAEQLAKDVRKDARKALASDTDSGADEATHEATASDTGASDTGASGVELTNTVLTDAILVSEA
jgi:hypothetical protein